MTRYDFTTQPNRLDQNTMKWHEAESNPELLELWVADVFEFGHAKLAADRERDEAQRDLGDQRQAVHSLLRRETEPLDAEKTQAVRADEHTRDQIRRHRRQLQGLCNTGHQQTRESGDRQG